MADINLGVGGANSAVAGGYDIDNSLKIEADNSERLQRVYSGQSGSISSRTPTSTKIATISFWIKRTELQPSGNHLVFLADANFTWVGFNNDGLYILGSTAGINLRSNGKFRDTSAWYHIVVAFDTTQITASNRVKVYVNGEQWTEFGVSENYGAQNNDIDLYDTNTSHYFGWSDAQSQSGYYAEAYLIDGQQLAPTEFGEFDSDSGIWKPKAYGGTFGNQGWYLDFKDSSDLGKDVSGNGNNFTAHYGGSAADQAVDTPTNNFSTFNPLHTNYGNYIEGASTIQSTGTGWSSTISTIAPASGKWYVEFKFYDTGPAGMIGVSPVQSSNNLVTGHYSGTSGDNGVSWYDFNGVIRNNAVGVATYSTWGNSDIVALALDLDNHKVYFAKNNTWQNSANPTTGTNGISLLDTSSQFYIGASFYYNGPDYIYGNYGGFSGFTISSAASDENGYGTFEYAPPSGYYALCTKNLAEYG